VSKLGKRAKIKKIFLNRSKNVLDFFNEQVILQTSSKTRRQKQTKKRSPIMAILTIRQRFQQSQKGKDALKKLKTQHKRSGASFNWTKSRPKLDVKSDLIPISSLHIDEDTQRDPFSAARIQKLKRIVSKPCAKQFKRIIVSTRT